MTFLNKLLASVVLLIAALSAHAGPVNVNTADAEKLAAELTGVGMAKARAIIEYREQNGPFRSAEELLNVSGVGERTLEMNREFIIIDTSKPGEGR